MINGQNQLVNGQAKLIAYDLEPELASAVIDLSDVYEGQAVSVQCGMAMLGRKQCLIQDEVVGLKNNDTLRWAILTSADIKIDGNLAVLTKGETQLTAKILEPGEGYFTVASPRPTYHPDEVSNPGTSLLTLEISPRI